MCDVQLSDAEVATVLSGVECDVRTDGRARAQHRPLSIRLAASLPAASANKKDEEDITKPNNAAATSAKKAHNGNHPSSQAPEDDDDAQLLANFGGGGPFGNTQNFCGSCIASYGSGSDGEESKVLVKISAEVIEVEDDGTDASGSLEIHFDCVPTVAALYGKVFSGGVSLRSAGAAAARRGQLAFASHVTSTLSGLLGAAVSVKQGGAFGSGIDAFAGQQQQPQAGGGAGASGGDDNTAGTVVADADASSPQTTAELSHPQRQHACSSFYQDLNIGSGFAYALHADVTILQGGGGGILTLASAALIAALRVSQLPHAEVVHHNDGSASVEVHPNKVRTGPGVANVGNHSGLLHLVDMPVLVASALYDGFYVMDPTLREEVALPTSVCIGVAPSASSSSSSTGQQQGGNASTAEQQQQPSKSDCANITYMHQAARLSRHAVPERAGLSNADDLVALATDAAEIAADIFEAIDVAVDDAWNRTA